MKIDYDELKQLPAIDKLQIIEFLRDDLEGSHSLADFISAEDLRRVNEATEEMDKHPERALTEKQMWAEIDRRREERRKQE